MADNEQSRNRARNAAVSLRFRGPKLDGHFSPMGGSPLDSASSEEGLGSTRPAVQALLQPVLLSPSVTPEMGTL